MLGSKFSVIISLISEMFIACKSASTNPWETYQGNSQREMVKRDANLNPLSCYRCVLVPLRVTYTNLLWFNYNITIFQTV